MPITIGSLKWSSALFVCGMIASTCAQAADPPQWCQDIAGGVFCAEPAGTPPSFCGTSEISFALADGFTSNSWYLQTTAVAINEISRCPNVTAFTHTDGQGNTQKAISDIQGLVATGVDAMVIFPNAGPALLPTIRDAYNQGITVVPYRVSVGGTAGTDYTVWVGTDFKQHGEIWGKWMAEALGGKGNVTYLGGPPGVSESTDKSAGIHAGIAGSPDVKWVGQEPFEVTNWDPSKLVQVVTGLIAQYPAIDGLFADTIETVLTSGAFERAGRPMPYLAGLDTNGIGCRWLKEKEAGEPSFQFTTTSSENWHVRLAIQLAIADAAGGTMDAPIVVTDTKGKEHIVANPGDTNVMNFAMDNSLTGEVYCDPALPETASNGNSLTVEQTVAALKGGL